MNAAQTEAIRRLESQLTSVAGVPVQITIRDENSFTWSTDERDEVAAKKLVDFARADSRVSAVSVAHDDECGSFVYVSVSA